MTRFPNRLMIAILAAGAFGSSACAAAPSPATVTPPPSPTPAPAAREFGCAAAGKPAAPLTVFISDLHFGLGRIDANTWNPLEDFRWTNALRGFLGEISSRGGRKTTLVIAGDMLEMWQHPGVCDTGDADHGCTMKEMEDLAATIVAQHADDLRALGAFAKDGDNHLVIIPGNHDAAMLKSAVNQKVLAAMNAGPGRVEVVAAGVWASPDCAIVSEHGHQMPNEQINGWKGWPNVTETFRGKEYFIRPWGEYFVHELYDKVEKDNSLIDNLIPQSNGVRHYMAKQGTLASAKDVARFLTFNIGEASINQILDLKVDPNGPPEWDVARARDLGWRLFANAADLSAANPDRDYLAKISNTSDSTWDPIRTELTALAHDPEKISDEDVKSLCDKAAAKTPPIPCPAVRDDLVIGGVAGAIPGAQYRAIASHLTRRAEADPFMRVFVYGHTHEMRCPVPVTPEGHLPVSVANTGAFQRLIDDAKFVEAAKAQGLTPEDGLSKLALEGAAPACYSAVLVTYVNGQPVAKVQSWYMNEADAAGRFVEPNDCLCAKLDPKCEPKKECP